MHSTCFQKWVKPEKPNASTLWLLIGAKGSNDPNDNMLEQTKIDQFVKENNIKMYHEVNTSDSKYVNEFVKEHIIKMLFSDIKETVDPVTF